MSSKSFVYKLNLQCWKKENITKQQIQKMEIFEKNEKISNIPKSKIIDILPFKAFIARHDENIKAKGYFSFVIHFPKIQATGDTRRKTLKNLRKATYEYFQRDDALKDKPSITNSSLLLMNCVTKLNKCSIVPFKIKVNIVDDELLN